MRSVLTLIADPAVRPLDDEATSLARAALKALGAEVGPADILAPGVAIDLPFDGLADEQAESAVRVAVGERPLDLAAQATEFRRKRILVADMESTIIKQEMLDELADFVGLRERIADITARAMNGEIDFKDALRERVALLKDLPAGVLDEVWGRVVLMPGAEALVATMRRNGAFCALVSGGFKPFTARVRDMIGFNIDQANDLEIADGKLTGRPIEPILDRDAKLAALLRFCAENRVPTAEAVTVGDGANDLPMLLAAGMGVAYHAKPSVAAQARVRIDNGDLTALLFLQGYHAGEFVGA